MPAWSDEFERYVVEPVAFDEARTRLDGEQPTPSHVRRVEYEREEAFRTSLLNELTELRDAVLLLSTTVEELGKKA